MTFYQIFPLGSALIYAIAALILKRAIQNGAGPWRTLFVVHLFSAIGYAPFLGEAGIPLQEIHWTHPFLAGAAFFTGQIFTFIALNRGEVSVATPVMGTKVLWVALIVTCFLGETIPLLWWIAAALSTAAVALMQGGVPHRREHLLPTLIASLLSAAAFATSDVLVQTWAPEIGFNRFVPIMFLAVMLFSFGLIPFFHGPLLQLSWQAWRWLIPGAALLTLQALGMAYSISTYGHATAINVVYTSRGMWSVVLVWWAGHWFENDENTAGHHVMGRRLAGSALIVMAIILISLPR